MSLDQNLFVEIVGYFASFMVLISFLMRNIKKLRLVNSVGCLAFVIYGVLLNWSLPIIITNVAIMSINFYYLFIKKQA
nr:uroporphyrinogen decarboxylase [Aquimarina sp. MMG016]